MLTIGRPYVKRYDEKSRLISNITVDDKVYSCLYFKPQDSFLPDNVYDIVIDAGHGGKDEGYTAAGYNEAEVCLEEAELLQDILE